LLEGAAYASSFEQLAWAAVDTVFVAVQDDGYAGTLCIRSSDAVEL
jgi:hypothetical protein